MGSRDSMMHTKRETPKRPTTSWRGICRIPESRPTSPALNAGVSRFQVPSPRALGPEFVAPHHTRFITLQRVCVFLLEWLVPRFPFLTSIGPRPTTMVSAPTHLESGVHHTIPQQLSRSIVVSHSYRSAFLHRYPAALLTASPATSHCCSEHVIFSPKFLCCHCILWCQSWFGYFPRS